MPHLGVVLPMKEWQALAARLEGETVDLVIAPSIRSKGEPGEQATMFLGDPSGNPTKIKGFANIGRVFAS